MTPLDAYSYYAGLLVAIIFGYLLSSLHIERFVLAAILFLPERVSGNSAKTKGISLGESRNTGLETVAQSKTLLDGLKDEDLFELERRAIFSKASIGFESSEAFLTSGNVDLALRNACL